MMDGTLTYAEFISTLFQLSFFVLLWGIYREVVKLVKDNLRT